MPAPVSVIIPTYEAATRLGPCLAALFEGVEAGLVGELVIADGGSTDGIEEIAEEIGAELVCAPKGRGTQLRAGVEAAKGAWLLVVHADTVLAAGWVEAAAAHIRAHPGKAGYGWLRFDRPGLAPRLVAGWANLRSRAGLPYGDQGLLIPRRLYNEAGGYPAIPIMEDVALARALKGRLVSAGFTAITSSERYANRGWLRQGARNLGTLGRYFAGNSPETLARRYER